MIEPNGELPRVERCYGSLTAMLRKYDRYARRDCFAGSTPAEFEHWRTQTRGLLQELLGLAKMEACPLQPTLMDSAALPDGIRREHWRIQTEPDVWMPFYLLVPSGAGLHTRPFVCPPGHNGAGKYTVAGLREYAAVADKIDHYRYDYGWQLARMGYVAVCPDCRGFGERREDPADTQALPAALKGDCYRLAHMGEPLGIPVAGMLVWDLMRLTDYLYDRGEWDLQNLSCLGFSGGGMQTLWLAALDERIRFAVISGYMYGCRDALLTLNNNCSCNYVPHLWEHLDMGDVASLIAPRPLLVQSCRGDRLNGPRGVVNAMEQVEIIRRAYALLGVPDRLLHEICEGPHQWHGENLTKNMRALLGVSLEESTE